MVDVTGGVTCGVCRYDRSLGGLEMTLRLRDHLADIFDGQKNRQSKVKDNPRAMAKLLAEADRVKRVLSANSGHHAQVTWRCVMVGECVIGWRFS